MYVRNVEMTSKQAMPRIVSKAASILAWVGLVFFASASAQAAPVISFSATPTAIQSGGTATLDWSVTDATSCTASSAQDGAWNGARSETGGSQVVSPTVDTTYTLTCTDDVDPEEFVDVVVTVGPPVTATLTSNFSAIPLGGSVLVTWSSANATSCVGTGFSTGGATSGSASVTPGSTGTVDFDVECTGAGDATGSDGISVTVGPAITANVSTDFSAIPLNGSVLVTWSSTDANSCTGTNFATGGATSGSVSVAPGSQGVIEFSLACSGDGGATGNGSASVTVGSPIAASVTTDISELPLGGDVLVTWSSSSATSCTGTNFSTGGATSGSVSVTPASQGVVDYQLDCSGDGGSTGSDSTSVTVGAPIVASVSADFTALPLGGSVLITWSSSDATSCAGTNFSTGGTTAGSISVTPGAQGAIDYTVLCSGTGGATGSDSVIVTVGPPITATLSADFTSFPLGGSALLTWSSSEATSCTGTGFPTGGATAGSVIVTPSAEGTVPFDLVCDGAGGASDNDSLNITVGPPITANLTADLGAVPLGGSVLLSWNSSQATSCTGTGFATGGATLGSVSVTPGSEGVENFDILCTGDGGASGSDGASVTVGPPVDANLSVDFSALPLGGTVQVTWSSTDANSCTGIGFTTGGATSGSVGITPVAQGPLQLDLDCVGDGGAPGSDSTTVTVGAPITASVTPDFASLPLGGSVLLTWSSTDANSCAGTNFATGGATSGSVSVTPGSEGAIDYDITCSGDGGASGAGGTTVVVGPPIGATVAPDFSALPLGGSVLLTWSSTSATSCVGTGFATGGATSGSISVTPGSQGLIQYDLDCAGNGGASGFASTTVDVGAPISATLTPDFSALPLGGSVLLTWSSADANSCVGTGFTTGGATSGSVSVTPVAQGAVQYDLDCTGNGGATGDTSTVIDVGAPVSVAIGSDFAVVPLGGTLVIDWTSSDANSCVGTGFSTDGFTSGMAGATPVTEGSATYTAVCTGNGGATGQASVIVNVIPPVAASLTSNFLAFPLGGSALLTWDSTSANSCTGTGFATGSATSGSIIVTPGVEGLAQFDLQCDGNGGAADLASLSIDVGPPISVSLTASPDFIALGGSSSLGWTSTDATSCSGDIFSTGGATSGTVPVAPGANTTYNISCTGAGGATGGDSATVDVGPPVTTSLSADFPTIALGGSSTLTWGSANADTCSASSPEDPSFTGPLATAGGTQLVSPDVTATYTITCVGPGNATDDTSLTVMVGPPVTVDLTADFTFIAEGGSSLLTWTSAEAQSCTGTNFSTGGNTNSSLSVSPTTQTTYQISCVGLGNAIETDSVTVDVGPPVVAELTSDLFFIALGGSAELSWTGSGGAASCTGDASFSTGGALVGAATVSPTETTVYTLTCDGPGNATDESTVTVTVGPAPTATLGGNFSSIPFGGTVQLDWTSENATSCTSADFATGGNIGGVRNVTPVAEGPIPYSITCSAPGGATATSVFIVTVTEPVSATIVSTFDFIASGGSADLDWSSTSANSCSGNIFATGGATSGTLNVAPTVLDSYTYTVTCVGDGGARGTDSVTVTVGPPVTATFSANPTFIALTGTSTLSWVGAGSATRCEDDGQFIANDALVGNDAVVPSSTTTYTVTCHGPGNAVETAEVTVDVGAAVVVDLSASLDEVAPGGTSTLTWATTGPASTCTGDLFLTGGALNGSTDVTPSSSTTYTVTCLAPGGVVETDQATVDLGPPVTATLVSDLPSVPLGGSINLSWTSTNASTCTSLDFPTGGLANGGPVSDTPGETQVYTIECFGAGGGSETASVSVTVGNAVAATLNASLDTIAEGGSTTLTWSSGNATLGCTGTNFDTGGAEAGSVVVSPTTTTTYFVECDGTGGTSANSSTQVTVVPALSINFRAIPEEIALGGGAFSTLIWETTSATSCVGDIFSTGNSPFGILQVSPTENTTYNITCSRAGSPDVNASVTVTVGPPVTATLTSDFPAIALGGSTTLTWGSGNADDCTATSVQDPTGWSGDVDTAGGTIVVTPIVTSEYELDCTGPGGGTANASVIVSVNPAVTASLSANPMTIPLGGSSTLSWSSANATSCTGDSFTTGGDFVGSQVVTPDSLGPQTYTLTCFGLGNVEVVRDVVVTVGPAVTATLTADLTFVAEGGSTTLNWSSTDANQCNGDVFATGTATSGSLSVTPMQTTTYTLTCIGAGAATESASVTVSVGPAVTANLSASDETIAEGGSSTLTWSSANATSCTASSATDPSFSGALAIGGGSQVVTPSATATYTIDCLGAGGASVNDSVTVAVGPPVTASLSADFTTIASGGTVVLSWLGTGSATNCSGDLFPTGGITSGSTPVSPTANTTYNLTCTGPGNASDVATLPIIVGPPVTASLTVDIASIAQGGSSRLSWAASPNATNCVGISAEDPTWAATPKSIAGGNQLVTPTVTATYTLQCNAPGNAQATSSVTVTVGAPVAATVDLDPVFINLGGSTEITWSSTDATSCAGDLFQTGGATAGTVSVSPTANTVYTLTCTGPGSATETATANVVVGDPVVSTLGASATFIAEGGSTTLTWNGENATTCAGDIFDTGTARSGSLVVSPTATTTYTVTCTGAGNATNEASVTVSVGPPVVASLSAAPLQIAGGGTSTLSWSGTGGATACTGDLFSTGGLLSGTSPVNPSSDQTYTVTCTGPGGATDTESVTVLVGGSVNATLNASLISIAPGGSTDLTWSSTNATSCLGDLFSTSAETTGTVSVSPTVTTIYTVTCSGAGGATDFASVTVTVTAPVTATLTADPEAIALTGSSALTWSSANATSCVGSGGGFDTGSNPNGTQTVSPSGTTVYTVTCVGAGGAEAIDSVTVTVGTGVTAILSASLETIASGGTTTLTWASGNADTCMASSPQDPEWQGDVDIEGGTLDVSPLFTSTYSLTCTGAGGAIDQEDVVVTVTPAVVADLTADPDEIAEGGTATLTWSAAGSATSCEGDLFATGDLLFGSVDVAPTETTTYTVTCYGLGGAEDSESVTVDVGPPVQTQLSANILAISAGGFSTLTWASANANECTASSLEDPAWNGLRSPSGGSQVVSPITDSTYTLVCEGDGGATQSQSLTITVGEGVTASLSADITSIAPGGMATLTWQGGGSATSCSGTGFPTGGALSGSIMVSPLFETTYTLTCNGAGGASAESMVTISVTGQVSTSLTAAPEAIALGGESLLTWTSSNADSCLASSAQDASWNGPVDVAGGTQVVAPTVRSTYEIVCTGAGGATFRDSVTVQVGPPVSVTFTAEPSDIALTGSALLSWSSSNAVSCTASSVEDSSWQGARSIAGGTQPVSPTVTSTYDLTCIGAGAAVETASVTVNVGAAPTAVLTATPDFINSGGSSTLEWTGAGGATQCNGDLFNTGGALTGSVPVSPTQATTYTLTCIGDGGAAISTTATVNVGGTVLATLSPDLSFIAEGGSATLTWGSGNAISCEASSSPPDASWTGAKDIGGGSQVVSPTTSSLYELRCDGEGGASFTAQVTITVGSAPQALLDADFFDIPLGGNVTLDWEGRGGATSCNGDANFATSGARSGEVTVSPLGNTTYTLTCLGAGGAAATDTVTVNVGDPVTATLTASPDAIALGGQSTLSWSSSLAFTCTGENFDTGGAPSGNRTVTPTATTTYSITCTGLAGAQSSEVSETIPVGPAPTATLTAAPEAIAESGTSTLTWSSTNANTCTGNGFQTGNLNSGSVEVTPSDSFTYSVTCIGDGGAEADDQATVSVGGQLLVSLSAIPQTIARDGTTTLTWDGSAVATSCVGSGPGFDTGDATSGTIDVSPTADATYTVNCSGPGGVSDDASVGVTVLPRVEATLSTDFPTVALGGSATLTWSSISATDCYAASDEDPEWEGARAPTEGTQLVTPSETSTYTLTCNASGGTTDEASITVTVGPEVTVDISADPTAIALGGSTDLTWVVENATSCQAVPDQDLSWQGARNRAGGTDSVSPSIDSTYTLECFGLGGVSSTDSVAVSVGPAVTVTLTSDPDLINFGGMAELTWSVANAETCTAISGGDAAWSGDRDPTGGSQVVMPTSNTTYQLECVGAGEATESDIAIINVDSPVVANLFASVETIALGGTTTLTWNSQRAGSCVASSAQDSDWNGDRVITGGSQRVTPTQTSTYSLTCTGLGAAQDVADVTVTVGPEVEVNLDASPNPIAPGGTTTLTWETENATSCVGDPFPLGGQFNGSFDVVNVTTTTVYTVRCLGLGGVEVEDQVTVVVGDPVAVSLDADPPIVPANSTSTISWTSANALSCTSADFETLDARSGSVDVSIADTAQTYQVECTGAGGVVESANVTVEIAPPPTATINGLSPIRVGGTSTIVWNSSGVSCTGTGFDTGGARQGSTPVTASVTTTYTVECVDQYGQTVSQDFVLVVLPGPEITFTSSVPYVQTGDTATLSWSVTGANACIALGAWDTSPSGTGTPVNASAGSQVVSPLVDALYVLRCFDSVGQNDTQSIQITIAPTIDIFFPDPGFIRPPDGVSSLIWSTNNADSCVSTNWDCGSGSCTGPGAVAVSPDVTTTYTLTCSGPGGPADTATVTVDVGTPIEVTLQATPERIGLGQTTTLRWESELADSCIASSNNDASFSGPLVLPRGSLNVSPTVDTRYTITCEGAGGSGGDASVTVTIADMISIDLSAAAEFVAPPPEGATDLIWSVTQDPEATFLTCNRSADPVSPQWNGANNDASGTRQVRPTEETEFTLRCTDNFYPSGTSASVTVGIAPIPVVNLTGPASPIATGGRVQLSWLANDDADYCEAPGDWAGFDEDEVLPTAGDVFVEPLETTTYRIECFNELQPTAGTSSTTVFVDPVRAVFDSPSWGEAVALREDGIAIVGSYEDGLRIVDVTNPAVPTEIDAWDPIECVNDTPFGDETVEFIIEDVTLDPGDEDGDQEFVYVSAGDCGVYTIDLHLDDFARGPEVVSIIDTNGWAEHVAMDNGVAYISDFNGGVLSFDFVDRANPEPLDGVAYDDASFGAALHTDIDGDRAYVASDEGLRVIDISNPRNMSVLSSVDTDLDNGFVPQAVRVWNGLAFLSSWTGGLLVFDVRGAPVLLPDRRIETDYAFYQLVIDETNELLYIAEGLSGVQIVDISGVDSNGRYVTLEQIDIGKFVWDIGLMSDGTVYVGYGELLRYTGGLQMIIDRPPVAIPAVRPSS